MEPEATNRSFGINLALLREARQAAVELKRGSGQVMYFETGQGSALSANAHHGVDQQTCEARAYGVAREFDPFLVNTVVGFIGPEYLFDGKQIIRAGLEDHFCGKLLGLPMGCDVCYTQSRRSRRRRYGCAADAACGGKRVNYVMGVPGAEYEEHQADDRISCSSYHDALYVRRLLGLRPRRSLRRGWHPEA